MRSGPRVAVLLAVLAATWLSAAPAMAAPTDVRVTEVTCSSVSVSAQGLPASRQLFLLVTNIATGKALGGGPSPVHSNSSGEVHAKRSLDLSNVGTVDVSIWSKKGETLTMAASEKAVTNCSSLPRTGGASSGPMLVFGAALLAAGAMLVWRTRGAAARQAR
jgi:LPXTG-motif cell wall-anchored protein